MLQLFPTPAPSPGDTSPLTISRSRHNLSGPLAIRSFSLESYFPPCPAAEVQLNSEDWLTVPILGNLHRDNSHLGLPSIPRGRSHPCLAGPPPCPYTPGSGMIAHLCDLLHLQLLHPGQTLRLAWLECLARNVFSSVFSTNEKSKHTKSQKDPPSWSRGSRSGGMKSLPLSARSDQPLSAGGRPWADARGATRSQRQVQTMVKSRGGRGSPSQMNWASCWTVWQTGPRAHRELQGNPRESHPGQQAPQPVLSAVMRPQRWVGRGQATEAPDAESTSEALAG